MKQGERMRYISHSFVLLHWTSQGVMVNDQAKKESLMAITDFSDLVGYILKVILLTLLAIGILRWSFPTTSLRVRALPLLGLAFFLLLQPDLRTEQTSVVIVKDIFLAVMVCAIVGSFILQETLIRQFYGPRLNELVEDEARKIIERCDRLLKPLRGIRYTITLDSGHQYEKDTFLPRLNDALSSHQLEAKIAIDSKTGKEKVIPFGLGLVLETEIHSILQSETEQYVGQ